jgi:hypothetical protein
VSQSYSPGQAVTGNTGSALIDSGALIEARELLYEYGFALLDAKDVLRRCKPSPLLDATLDRSIQTGLHDMDYLDEAIEKENPQ